MIINKQKRDKLYAFYAAGRVTWATMRLRMTLVEVEPSGRAVPPPLEWPEGAGLGPPELNCFSERSVTGSDVFRLGGVGGGLAANNARIWRSTGTERLLEEGLRGASCGGVAGSWRRGVGVALREEREPQSWPNPASVSSSGCRASGERADWGRGHPVRATAVREPVCWANCE